MNSPSLSLQVEIANYTERQRKIIPSSERRSLIFTPSNESYLDKNKLLYSSIRTSEKRQVCLCQKGENTV